jgi:hypothetical protein
VTASTLGAHGRPYALSLTLPPQSVLVFERHDRNAEPSSPPQRDAALAVGLTIADVSSRIEGAQ